ncbi:glycosyltransferase family 4 protein [Desulfosarcina ovata]|uniref:glycosyltransferase family 4 protein n=1 Tax=Desulfosarcina ovata TaxID=83564 RepID=UPI0012D309F7|nr:glycosyltransferase family 4 protein [Desulfosarcina ovata]
MNSKLLFLFPDRANPRLTEVKKGLVPSDRLYGLFELRNLGWDAEISDSRWEGRAGHLRRNLKRICELPCPTTIRNMRKSDIIIVKDDFSATLLTEARLLGKPLIYLDAMFDIPLRRHRRMAIAYNLKYASAVCCYSMQQALQWAEAFELPISRFDVMPYCIDTNFYPEHIKKPKKRNYVFAVGRDLGRDFDTLFSACEKLGVALKLVTLPYLAPQKALSSNLVQVFQNITYTQLFELYSNSAMAVIPLKQGTSHLSGIRALLESSALGIPTVATKTPVLSEYLQDKKHVRYTTSTSIDAMADEIQSILDDPFEAEEMALRASIKVRTKFKMQQFTRMLEKVITRI